MDTPNIQKRATVFAVAATTISIFPALWDRMNARQLDWSYAAKSARDLRIDLLRGLDIPTIFDDTPTIPLSNCSALARA